MVESVASLLAENQVSRGEALVGASDRLASGQGLCGAYRSPSYLTGFSGGFPPGVTGFNGLLGLVNGLAGFVSGGLLSGFAIITPYISAL